MIAMFGGMLKEMIAGPQPIPPPVEECEVPALPEETAVLLAGMEPQEALDYALTEGRKFYSMQQIGGFMREQAKVKQLLDQPLKPAVAQLLPATDTPTLVLEEAAAAATPGASRAAPAHHNHAHGITPRLRRVQLSTQYATTVSTSPAKPDNGRA